MSLPLAGPINRPLAEPTRPMQRSHALPALDDYGGPAAAGDSNTAQMAALRALVTRQPHTITVVDRRSAAQGGWIEHLKDADPHFPQRNFLPSQRQRHSEIVATFGTATPPSGSVQLHFAGDPPQGVEVRPTPVILVHGAKVDGSFYFRGVKGDGVAQKLRDQGYQVYAVTFAHNQDDNYLQAQQLANVVARVRQLTAASQVDLVGHSKGCIPATVYATPGFRQDWMSAYQGDVRRLLLLGGPNGGVDYFHRHPLEDMGASNWPMAWNSVTVDGVKKDCSAFLMGPQGPWPGAAQLAARWDARYPLPQWDESSRKTYNGGSSTHFEAPGIDHDIALGDHFMEKLQTCPLASEVQVGLLAGNRADVPNFQNEDAGPSDGIILVDSALQAPKDAQVKSSQVLPCNHIELVWGQQAQQCIADFLGAP